VARATGSAVAEASSQKKAKPAPQREHSEVKAMDVNEGRKEFGCTCATQKNNYKGPGRAGELMNCIYIAHEKN